MAVDSAEPTAQADADPAARGPRERRALLRFMLQLGHLLLATGAPAGLVESTLRRVAQTHRMAQFHVLALPTVLFVNFTEDEAMQLEFTAEQGLQLRFDQIEAVYELARKVERSPIAPDDGLRRINAILAMAPPLRLRWVLLGHVLATVGIALVLQPTIDVVAAAAFFGLVVGLLKIVAGGRGVLTTLLPTVSAFVVALLALLATKHGYTTSSIYVLIASLVTFLPGGVLATAAVELAYGDVVSGGTRLVSGFLQLVFLILGMLAAASLVGLPPADLLVPTPDTVLRASAGWLGVLLFGIGHVLHYSARLRTLPWILAVLAVAHLGQIAGNVLFGGYMSGFFAAMVVTPVAYLVQYRLGGPPNMVTWTPALWLLVPGSLGLIGMAELAGNDHLAGLEDFVVTLFSITGIALGSVIGTGIYGTLFDPVIQRAGTMADLMLRYLKLRR